MALGLMGGIVIVIDPRHITNPDTDLSNVVPDAIDEHSHGLLRSDGWAYSASDSMHLYFLAHDMRESLSVAISILSQHMFKGNDLSGSVIGYRAGSVGSYEVLHPQSLLGTVIEDVS